MFVEDDVTLGLLRADTTNMDVFLEQVPGRSRRSLISRIAVSRPLQATTVEALVPEIAELVDHGIRYVSLRRQQLLQLGEHTLQEMLTDAGISVSCVGFAGGFTGALGLTFEQSLEDTRRAIESAADLDARYLVLLPGEQGLHTYNHAERSIRIGLTNALYHARRRQIRLLVPTATVLGHQKDHFRPRQCPLTWVERMTSDWIRPMIVVRGRNGTCHLPEGWRQSLAQGGCLRICHRCKSYERNARILNRLLTFLSRNSGLSDVEAIAAE